MRLGYIVLAHAFPAETARLVDRLADQEDQIFLHVDASSDARPFAEAFAHPSVIAVSRVRCAWGGYGLVEATLRGLRAALATTAPPDYVLLLSGQDYPIAPRSAIESRLDGRVFLAHRPYPAPDFPDGGGMDRLQRWYLRPSRRWSLPNRFTPFLPRRQIPGGLTPHGGSQFWALPTDVARAILDYVDANPWYERFFRRAFVADESFFQMIVLNGPHADRVVNDDLHFSVHPRGAAHPRVLVQGDMEAIRTSGALFARKFQAAVDAGVLDAIEHELLDS